MDPLGYGVRVENDSEDNLEGCLALASLDIGLIS